MISVYILIGTEFKNRILKEFLDAECLKHYLAYSTYHANYAERGVRTVNAKLYHHFSKNETTNWMTALDSVADSLNTTIHSATKIAPNDISIENEREVYEKVYLSLELKREKILLIYHFKKG